MAIIAPSQPVDTVETNPQVLPNIRPPFLYGFGQVNRREPSLNKAHQPGQTSMYVDLPKMTVGHKIGTQHAWTTICGPCWFNCPTPKYLPIQEHGFLSGEPLISMFVDLRVSPYPKGPRRNPKYEGLEAPKASNEVLGSWVKSWVTINTWY